MMKNIEKESFKDEIIEENDELGKIVTFKTSELIRIINKHYPNNGIFGSFEVLDFENFGKKYSIPKIICQKTKIKNFIIHKEIYYNDVKLLLSPLIIDFVDLDERSVVYKIYNINYIYKIIKLLDFKNPVIVKNQKEYSLSSLDDILSSLLNEFKIEDKKVIDYDTLFLSEDNKNNKLDVNFKIGLDLAKNFKYYFKCPKPEEEFHFISSNVRSRIFSNDFKKKIIGLCGPMGIGKSTTLLALMKLKGNYCYFNIKALKEYENEIFVWKEQLLLSEVAYALRNNYTLEIFNGLKKDLNNISFFWEAIKTTINYFIKTK